MSDLFGTGLNDGMSFLDKKEKAKDGIYRPSIKLAKDKKVGYKAKIRFLKNLTVEGSVGENAEKKILHFVNIEALPDYKGYIDSMNNFDEKCELSDLFWKYKNSENVVEQEKSKLIARSTKYYSYVQIIEDEQQPELVGKIMILPFGMKIKEKIDQELKGMISDPCNVYDLANGKDFILIVKEVGGFPNYDSSQFVQVPSPMYIGKEVDGAMSVKQIPTEQNDKGLNVIPAKFQETVRDYLMTRDVDLSTYSAVRWDDETRSKVKKIVSFLVDNKISSANEGISNVAKLDSDSYFDETEDTTSNDSFTETTETESTPSNSSDFFDV